MIPSNLKTRQYLMRNEMYLSHPSKFQHRAKYDFVSIELLCNRPHRSSILVAREFPLDSPTGMDSSNKHSDKSRSRPGTGVPSSNELVSMQTLYSDLTFPNIYGESVSFTIPGPQPVAFDGPGGSTKASTTFMPKSTSSSSRCHATSPKAAKTEVCLTAMMQLGRRSPEWNHPM
ncbi:hypothetical protein BDN70DRAFT_875396 [Pholiota conissans]|uniref:Uncharacterized protein n=1 Tax=Pholiota conissans TaxID=109636 RepID=A0A9P5Z5S3_9AGAR|nr:hypothetical protein BDN70DRAFT_875396 [Pholiota conissans]